MDINREELDKLEYKIREGQEELTKGYKERSFFIEEGFNEKYKNLENNRLNYLKGLSVVSGITAPLSLTLFQVKTLEINTLSLIFGFVVLLIHIVYSHFIFFKDITLQDKDFSKGVMYKIFADSDLRSIQEKKYISEIQEILFNINNNLNNSEEILESGNKYMNKSSLKISSKISENIKNSTFIFFLGIILIIYSILVPFIFSLIVF